jgi:hypothetical protein
MVKMARAGGCYQDNPADYIQLMGLHALHCYGFVQNYHECSEQCPFGIDSEEAGIREGKNYTIF